MCFSRLANTDAPLKGIHEGREVFEAPLLNLTPDLHPWAAGNGC